jgi:hypothetical protein
MILLYHFMDSRVGLGNRRLLISTDTVLSFVSQCLEQSQQAHMWSFWAMAAIRDFFLSDNRAALNLILHTRLETAMLTATPN